jgi:hypothetical protein
VLEWCQNRCRPCLWCNDILTVWIKKRRKEGEKRERRVQIRWFGKSRPRTATSSVAIDLHSPCVGGTTYLLHRPHAEPEREQTVAVSKRRDSNTRPLHDATR